MVKTGTIAEFIEKIAPAGLACDWDNVGLLVGDSEREVGVVLTALDATEEVVAEAVKKGAGLIVTHHPLLRGAGVTSVRADEPLGKRLITLIENKIAVYSAHTNFDAADGGTNDTLCAILGIEYAVPFMKDGAGYLGRVGVLRERVTLRDFAAQVGRVLNCGGVRFVGDGERVIGKAAVCAGGGGDADSVREAAKTGADCYITGDTRYHAAQEALALGLSVIDATHYATERPAVDLLADKLQKEFGEKIKVIKSEFNGQVYKALREGVL